MPSTTFSASISILPEPGLLCDAGYLAMGGQIVDATVVQARRPRLRHDEKATVKRGAVPEGWSKAKRAQMDTDGRWTLKRGRKRPAERSHPDDRSELVIPVFGYKNHLGIDRRHGFIRSFTVTDAAAHDGRQLDELLDPENTASIVWADAAYRSAANVALLARRGLVPQFQRAEPRGRPRCRRTSPAALVSPTCAVSSGSRPIPCRPDLHPGEHWPTGQSQTKSRINPLQDARPRSGHEHLK